METRSKRKRTKRDLELSLISESWNGNLVEVKRLLEVEGVNINARINGGQTALIRTVWRGHNEVATLLVAKGIDVNIQGYLGYTALIVVSCEGNAKIAKLLLETKNINVNVRNNGGNMALHRASYYGYTEIVKLLLRKGADVAHVVRNLKSDYVYDTLDDEIKQALENWKHYLPEWTTKTHKYYPQEFKEAIVTWLLVVATQKRIKKCINKDMRTYLIPFIAAAYKNH